MSHTSHKLFEAYALVAVGALALLGFSYQRDFRQSSAGSNMAVNAALVQPVLENADSLYQLEHSCKSVSCGAECPFAARK